MSAALNTLLDACLPLPEVAGAAIRLPDRSVIQRVDSTDLTARQVEEVLNQLILAAETIAPRSSQHTLSWCYDHARLYLTRRADGAMLALIVQRHTDQPETGSELQLIQTFHQAAAG